MSAVCQRISDWLRERRIRRLRAGVIASVNAGQKTAAYCLLHRMAAEINARSPGQVARMERNRGISHA